MSARRQILQLSLFALCASSWLAAHRAEANLNLTILHSFAPGTADGSYPSSSLVLSGSQLYGTTYEGGAFNGGTAFRINTDGTGHTLLHSFAGNVLNDGQNPRGTMVLVGDALFGTTASFDGTLFRVNTDGTGYSVLHWFPLPSIPADGTGPQGSLALSGTTLYGTTIGGGASDLGTAYHIETDGTGFALMHQFAGGAGDGAMPYINGPTRDGSTLYGMTPAGGVFDRGTIYSINTDGTGFGLVHSFTSFVGAANIPEQNELTVVGSTLYGMTNDGGVFSQGAIFRVNTDGSNFQILHSFNYAGTFTDGQSPAGILTLRDSTLYGMTELGGAANLGTIFQINTDGTGYEVAHSFTGGASDGAVPVAGSLTLSGSTLYGLASLGGAHNRGVVFTVTVPEPATVVLATIGMAALWVAARKRRRAGCPRC